VAAAAGGDRAQTAAALEQRRTALDRSLTAANPLLPPNLLAQQMRASDQALLTAADAFVAGDSAMGLARAREAARASQKAADTLALSIVDRFPGKYLRLSTRAAAPPR
jgi:hypothetical protein